MTTTEWLAKAKEHNQKLRSLVADWHPSARYPKAIQQQSVLVGDSAVAIPVPEASMPITAPNAERACQVVRGQIRQEQPENPVERWDQAIVSGDANTLMSLLSGAWFGVPESTSCWEIEGFSEACDLLDDPPGDEDREPPHPTGCICADCSGAELLTDND